jgi:hypothetical protein
MNGHFTLNKSGQFTLTLEDYSYRPSSNPFADQKLGLWECTGFSVSGTVDKDIEDPAEFDGKLSSDSISLSGSHSMTTAYVYEDDSDTEGKLSSENRKWQTSGSGASIGTIHYKFDTATGNVTVTLTMDIPMHCEVTTTSRYIGYEDPVIKTEENDMTEASVVLKFTFKMP